MDRAGKRSIQVQVGEPVSLVGLLTGRCKGSYTTRKSLGRFRDYQKSIVYFLHMKEGVGRASLSLHKEFPLSISKTGYDCVCVYSSLTWYINILNLNSQSCCHWWYKPQSPAINYKVMLIGYIWWGCHACDHSCLIEESKQWACPAQRNEPHNTKFHFMLVPQSKSCRNTHPWNTVDRHCLHHQSPETHWPKCCIRI